MDLHFEEHDNKSLKRFEKMLKTDAIYFFDSTEFERIIKYYIDSGKINLANKAITLGLQQHPATSGLRLLKAEMLIIEDKFAEALRLLNEVEALEPTNEEVFIQKALLLSKKEKHEEAIQLLKKVLEFSEEDNLDVLSLIGMEYLFLEDFERALLYFKNCLEIEADDHTNLYNIVYCYDMLNQGEKAIVYLNKHIDREPFSEVAWHQLGRQYALLEKHNESLQAFDYALLIDDQFIGAYLEKAQVLEEVGRYREAIENYLITTELDDPSAFAFFRIGKNFEKLKNSNAASEYYLKSNEQDPFLDKPLVALANLYFEKEEYNKTLFYLNMLIEIDDENPEYWRLYALSNLKISFFNEAANAFRKCIELGGNNLETYMELADTYYYIGDLKESIKILLEAEIYYHNHVDIEYRLSGLYFLIKSTTLAEQYLLKALQKNPNKYRLFQSLFPVVYNSKIVKGILLKFRNNN